MPEGFPAPPFLSDEEVRIVDEQCEKLWGPVMGAFVLGEVTNGDHPQQIKEAWAGVRVPVRRDPNQGMAYGSKYVCIDPAEAYNALVASGASDDVLQYWIDRLPEGPNALLGFLAQDGQYEHFLPDSEQSA